MEAIPLTGHGRSVRLFVFTGPFMPEDAFSRILQKAGSRVTVARFTRDFLRYMAAADLSVSMAGYNTCMSLLVTGVQAAVWPFPGDREQGLRAERLAGMNRLRVIRTGELAPKPLARIIDACLSGGPGTAAPVDLGGAEKTAEQIVRYAAGPAAK